MIFRPSEPYRLWDTWLFEDNGKFHLFYLRGVKGEGFPTIGHAVSDDLINWKDLESIASGGDTGSWDAGGTKTGTTVKKGDTYYLFYGGGPAPELNQRVGIMTSSDLIHWKKYPGNPVFESSGPYYLSKAMPVWDIVTWRDPCIFWNPEKKEYDCFITGRQEQITDGIGTVIAHAVSTDLINWKLKPPVSVLSNFMASEVPDYFSLDGIHYLLFTSLDGRDREFNTPGRKRPVGTFYVISNEKYDNYDEPEDPFLIGAGNSRFDNYAGKTIQFGKERLLYYHMVADRCAFALPKKLKRQSDNSLIPVFWDGFLKLEKGKPELGFSSLSINDKQEKGFGSWSLDMGKLRGISKLLPSIVFNRSALQDFHLQATIIPFQNVRAGIALRYDENTRKGIGIIIDTGQRSIDIGEISPAWFGARKNTPGFRPWDTSFNTFETGYPLRLRVIARSEFVEVYINDRWCFSTTVKDYYYSGLVGYLVESGRADFTDVRISNIKSLS